MCCSENCQTILPFCVHHTMETPNKYKLLALCLCSCEISLGNGMKNSFDNGGEHSDCDDKNNQNMKL